MQEYIKSGKSQPSFEINWQIRELFSEDALVNFFSEIDIKKISLDEKNKNN